MLVMMVAASGFAQDSYREAVKDYLALNDQFEKTKSLLSTLNMIFEKNDLVDIDQLSNRYISERLEDDLVDNTMPKLMAQGLTETDLREIISLLSTPAGKTYQAHQQEWSQEFLTQMFMSMISQGTDIEQGEELELMPIQPDEDIDAAYAAKFNKVMETSGMVSTITDAMLKRINEDSHETSEKDESRDKYINWLISNLPVIALNSAYGIMTTEDMDYAEILYSKDSYRKLENFNNIDTDALKTANIVTSYMEWMKEQGAKESEDPSVALNFMRALMNQSFDLEDIDVEPFDLDE